jgi:hypothetical protein
MAAGQITVKDHRRLCPCKPALGVKQISGLAVDHSAASGPVYCRFGIGSDLSFIGKILRILSGWTPSVPPKDCRHLLTGHRVIRTETSIGVTSHDAVF